MKTILLLVLAVSLNTVAQENKSKSQFTRGSTIILSDSLKGELLGEFPSKWDLAYGSVEVAEFDEKMVIAYTSKAEIMPLMSTTTYLPEIFTIEFDVYFHLQGNESYTIDLDKLGKFTIRSYYVLYKGNKGMMKENMKEPGWRHVAISFNKRAFKMYVDNYRVLNIPNLSEKPSKVSFSALSAGAGKGIPSVLTNIIIAEGGEDLYNRLMSDGKIVTNDIHFESGNAILKPESMKIIDQIVQLMNDHSELKFRIEGHTDSDGTEESNIELSEQRANAVKDNMVTKGIAESRLQTKGYGESQPLTDNSSPENKAKNRRVEFIMLK